MHAHIQRATIYKVLPYIYIYIHTHTHTHRNRMQYRLCIESWKTIEIVVCMF